MARSALKAESEQPVDASRASVICAGPWRTSTKKASMRCGGAANGKNSILVIPLLCASATILVSSFPCQRPTDLSERVTNFSRLVEMAHS